MLKTKKSSGCCNICGCPQKVYYKEQDKDTGQIVEKFHVVQCGGHPGINPFLWNKSGAALNKESQTFLRSAQYDDYQKYIVRKREQTITLNKEKKNVKKTSST